MTDHRHGRRMRRARWRLALAFLALLVAVPLSAEDAGGAVGAAAEAADAVDAALAEAIAPAGTEAAPAVEVADGASRGSVTHLPLPRFVSLKTAEGNARRGPSLSHRIDWVFVRRDMPLEITGEYGHWRRVRDRDGAGGWVHYSLLSGVRTVVVTDAMADLRMRPEPGAPVVARAEGGVVARLGDCDATWCRISAGGQRGWVEKARLWGVGADEVRG